VGARPPTAGREAGQVKSTASHGETKVGFRGWPGWSDINVLQSEPVSGRCMRSFTTSTRTANERFPPLEVDQIAVQTDLCRTNVLHALVRLSIVRRQKLHISKEESHSISMSTRRIELLVARNFLVVVFPLVNAHILNYQPMSVHRL
jgi:hypothetical protein